MKSAKTSTLVLRSRDYGTMLNRVVSLIEEARCASARTVNALMTATYWLIGRHIVEFEQHGKARAEYGAQLIKQLAADLSDRYGRGFSKRNLAQMRLFYLGWPILQTPSAKCATGGRSLICPPKAQTLSAELIEPASRFPLPWSAYVRLLSLQNEQARKFYEAEALRGGWSVRQLDRQINSLFYERTALSRNKAKMLAKSAAAQSGRCDHAGRRNQRSIHPRISRTEGRIFRVRHRTCADSASRTVSPRAWRRFCVYRATTPSPHRRRMVSDRSTIFFIASYAVLS